MDIATIKRAAALADEYQQLELAMQAIEGGLANRTFIWRLAATDDAESERSVEVRLTVEETHEVFEAVRDIIGPRFERLKSELDALEWARRV